MSRASVVAAKASVSEIDKFALLQLPAALDIDSALLEQRYRALQAQWHPDRFAAAGVAEKLAAVQRTSLLNDAYTTLKAPLARAAHLLQLRGCDVSSVRQSDLEPAYLLHQMQLRDALEELAAAQDETGLQQLAERVAAERADLWRELEAAVAAGAHEEGLGQARRLFHKLQFTVKLQDEIRTVEDRLLGY